MDHKQKGEMNEYEARLLEWVLNNLAVLLVSGVALIVIIFLISQLGRSAV